MSTQPGGETRSLGRVAALFAITLGAYWPLWLVQVVPLPSSGTRARRARIGVAAGALLPVLNVAFEVALALLLPRAMRRRGAANTETHAFLLFAAPVAAVALTVALGWPFWIAGYLAWPLELPAALAIQSSLNRLGEGRRMPSELPASIAISAAIITGGVLLLALGGSDEKKPKPSTATAQQDNQVSDIAATHGALWVTKIDDNAVAQFDPATQRPTGKQIRVGRSPYDLAPGFGDLWVADYRSDSVSRVDPATARTKGGLIPTGRGPFGVAVGYGSVWVTNEVDRNLVEINPRTNRVRRKIQVGLGPRGVAVGDGAVWVAGAGSVAVIRVDPASGKTKTIPMPGLCQDVAVGGGTVWAIMPQENTAVRVDAATGRRVGKLITTGFAPASVDYGDGSAWVANGDGTVTQIDGATGRVRAKRAVGSALVDLTVRGRDVWVLRKDGVVRRIHAG